MRNLRAAGTGTLRVGRRTETFTAVVGRFFGDLDADSAATEIAEAAHRFPAFRVDTDRIETS